jgi:hypothetical protein
MRLLWIATKPPVPPIDGGRLVAWTTLFPRIESTQAHICAHFLGPLNSLDLRFRYAPGTSPTDPEGPRCTGAPTLPSRSSHWP